MVMTPSEPDRTRLDARAHDQGRVYQVGHGVQYITNAYYGDSSRQPAPLDLPHLRKWIDQLLGDYRDLLSRQGSSAPQRHLWHLERVQGLVADPPARPGKDAVRRLVVAGVVEYVALSRAVAAPASEHVVLDMVVFALWPVVRAPALPDDWWDHLAGITSPRLAAEVANARRDPATTCESFTRAVAAEPFGQAALSLLEDLADPARGGPALTAMAMACRLPEPAVRKGPRTVFAWFVTGAAAAGLLELDEVGGAVSTLFTTAWAWIAGDGARLLGPPGGGPALPGGDAGGDPGEIAGSFL